LAGIERREGGAGRGPVAGSVGEELQLQQSPLLLLPVLPPPAGSAPCLLPELPHLYGRPCFTIPEQQLISFDLAVHILHKYFTRIVN